MKKNNTSKNELLPDERDHEINKSASSYSSIAMTMTICIFLLIRIINKLNPYDLAFIYSISLLTEQFYKYRCYRTKHYLICTITLSIITVLLLILFITYSI